MSIRSMLRQRCTISRAESRTPNANYVTVPSYASQQTNVPCLIQDKGAKLETTIAGRNMTFNAIGFFLPDADIQPNPTDTEQADQVQLTSGGNGTYETRGVMDEAGHQKFLAVKLESV